MIAKPAKAAVAVAMPALVAAATVVAVVAKAPVVTVVMAEVAVVPIAAANFSQPVRKAHVPRKTVARAVKAVAAPSSSRPQALPMKVVHRAPLPRNPTPCAPASI